MKRIFTCVVVRRSSERRTGERNGEREAAELLYSWYSQEEKSQLYFTRRRSVMCARTCSCVRDTHWHVHACPVLLSHEEHQPDRVFVLLAFVFHAFVFSVLFFRYCFSLSLSLSFFLFLALLISFQESEDEFSFPLYPSLVSYLSLNVTQSRHFLGTMQKTSKWKRTIW